MIKKNILYSKRLQEVRKKKRAKRGDSIAFYLVLFLLIFFALGFLSKQERININNITISGNKIIKEGELKEFIEKELSDNYFFFFPKSNVFLYPKEEIKNKLIKKYTIIENISLKLSRSALNVSISEKIGKYLWCGVDILSINSLVKKDKKLESLESNEDCYFMDKNGEVFAKAPHFSGDVYFKFYGYLVNQDNKSMNPIGLHFPEFFKNVDFLISEFQNIKIHPVSILLKDDDNVEVYLRSKKSLQNSPKIIFKKDADLQKIIESLKIILNEESFKKEFNNNYDSLRYIDLRFGNKIPYVFKK